MKSFDELEKSYKIKQTEYKNNIKLENNKFIRLLKWLWFYITYPFIWIWVNVRDIKTLIIFIIVFVVVSSEVWIPYLLGFIFWGNESLRITMFSVGSACLLFWNVVPCTPFLGICIVITIAIKTIINKLKTIKGGKYNEKKDN